MWWLVVVRDRLAVANLNLDEHDSTLDHDLHNKLDHDHYDIHNLHNNDYDIHNNLLNQNNLDHSHNNHDVGFV